MLNINSVDYWIRCLYKKLMMSQGLFKAFDFIIINLKLLIREGAIT